MKKNYQEPTMKMVMIQAAGIICGTSEVKTLSTNGDVGLTYGGGGSGSARSRQYDSWAGEDE